MIGWRPNANPHPQWNEQGDRVEAKEEQEEEKGGAGHHGGGGEGCALLLR